MEYQNQVILKNGAVCMLRNGVREDAQAVLDQFNLTHRQTDFLASYPDENTFTVDSEAEFLERLVQSPREVEILAFIDGVLAGTAGIMQVGESFKESHRASFGVSIDQAFWGMGIGRALTQACISCAKKADYAQLELDVVAENHSAISLYRSIGFQEYGRNPQGMRSRFTGWQELVLMRLELED